MVFIETTIFTRLVQKFLSDDAYRALQQTLLEQPDIGPVIQNSGGLRKMRWSMPGHGKSSGVRVIYYLVTNDRILMLYIYPKGKQEDLSAEQLKRLRRLIEEEE